MAFASDFGLEVDMPILEIEQLFAMQVRTATNGAFARLFAKAPLS